MAKQSGKSPQVSEESLQRIFLLPEGEDSTLSKIEKQISENLHGFLGEHIVAKEISPGQIEKYFSSTKIPEDPIFVSEQSDYLLEHVVSGSVHTASPTFVGHMTSAIPYFMLPLAKIMMALNQNLVKIETSKAFTPLERQVVGMLHELVYGADESFYRQHVQSSETALGTFCSGGTVSNLTALWVARNRLLPEVSQKGMTRSLLGAGYRDAVVLVSKRGHYSLAKATDILGLGRDNLVMVETDASHRMDPEDLQRKIKALQAENFAIVAIVGIAGTTETGTVDPLDEIAHIASDHGIHFHVDGAWGTPTLFSETHRHKLRGIEKADSLCIDAHKQLYVPMGVGLTLFKDPQSLQAIKSSAQYIIRDGSRDLGKFTLEGSRPGMAVLVHSGLRVIGRKGYGLLIDRSMDLAKKFADFIKAQDDFELISAPELNLLTYRYFPAVWREGSYDRSCHDRLVDLCIKIQKEQRDHGKSFVSRTTFPVEKYHGWDTTVFRVVLANPLTKIEHLEDMIVEQRAIGQSLLG